jgi:hypothetical protein
VCNGVGHLASSLQDAVETPATTLRTGLIKPQVTASCILP